MTIPLSVRIAAYEFFRLPVIDRIGLSTYRGASRFIEDRLKKLEGITLVSNRSSLSKKISPGISDLDFLLFTNLSEPQKLKNLVLKLRREACLIKRLVPFLGELELTDNEAWFRLQKASPAVIRRYRNFFSESIALSSESVFSQAFEHYQRAIGYFGRSAESKYYRINTTKELRKLLFYTGSTLEARLPEMPISHLFMEAFSRLDSIASKVQLQTNSPPTVTLSPSNEISNASTITTDEIANKLNELCGSHSFEGTPLAGVVLWSGENKDPAIEYFFQQPDILKERPFYLVNRNIYRVYKALGSRVSPLRHLNNLLSLTEESNEERLINFSLFRKRLYEELLLQDHHLYGYFIQLPIAQLRRRIHDFSTLILLSATQHLTSNLDELCKKGEKFAPISATILRNSHDFTLDQLIDASVQLKNEARTV